MWIPVTCSGGAGTHLDYYLVSECLLSLLCELVPDFDAPWRPHQGLSLRCSRRPRSGRGVGYAHALSDSGLQARLPPGDPLLLLLRPLIHEALRHLEQLALEEARAEGLLPPLMRCGAYRSDAVNREGTRAASPLQM